MARPEPSPGWLRSLFSLLGPHRRDVAVALGSAAVGQVVLAIVPLLQRQIVDEVILDGTAPLLPGLLALLAASAVIFGASYLRRYRAGRVSLSVQHDLRTRLHDHLQRLDVGRHDQMLTGQLVSRSISDIGLVQGLLAFLPLVLANGLFLLVALGAMLWLSPMLTIVAVAITPLMVLTSLRLRSRVYPASWDAQQQAGAVAGVVDESITGVRVVKGFGREAEQVERLADAATGLYASRLRVLRLTARYQPLLAVLPLLAQAGVLGLGGWLAIRGRISLGTFLAFTSYVGQLQAPARMLGSLVTVAQQARAGLERIFDLLNTTATVTSAPGAPPLDDEGGRIDFEGVTFGYRSSEPVLDGFDLSVAAGETVAIVGTSGSGKSTLALLLPRFYDLASGRISIDGVDISTVELGSLRRSIGFVFEDAFLFSDTIAANIAYGRPDADRSEIEDAARIANADGFISDLPDGYDTAVGERGLTLSGGQRQRIALARAVLTDPRILVLDDATSAVDIRVEAEIHAALKRVLAGRTTLLIAHRRSTLALADRVAVVDGGRLLDVGSHEELMGRCGLYRALLEGPGDELLSDATAPIGEESRTVAGPSSSPEGGAEEVPTPHLWVRGEGADAHSALVAAGRRSASPGLGMGLGPGTGGADVAASPDLIAAVDALPEATDRPDLAGTEAAAQVPTPFGFGRFISRWRWQLAAALGLVIADGLLSLTGPLLIRHGIDSGVNLGLVGPLRVATIAFVIVVASGFVVQSVQLLLTGRVAERILFALRVAMFGHMQRLGLDHHDREMAGRTMTRMTNDTDALSQLLQTGLVNAVVALLTGLGVGVALFVMDLRLAVLSLAVVPPLAVATVWFRRRSTTAYDEARERVASVNANFQESLSDVRVAQVHGREELDSVRFDQQARRYFDSRLRAQRLVAIYFPFVQFLSGVAGAIVIAGGAGMVRDGSLSPGELIAFLLYLELFFGPIQQLSQVFDTYQQARVAMDRIGELLDEESSVPLATNPIDPGRVIGRIEFVGVRFAYPDTEREVLDGLDLVVEPGETLAIVGETGAGKSTVEKLVARYYDVTGGVTRIDGVDLRDLDLTAYRRHLGVVPQEPFLFAGTIRDNLAFGRPEASDAEVEAAARAVGAHEVISRLPGGYLHVVSEGGRSLSAGERQLMALARALLPDPSILLLDEATANLDLATEAAVAAAMAVAGRDRTTLVIAHRLTTAAAADRVAVIDAGRVVEIGHHRDLLDSGGRYAELWETFASQGSR